MFNDNALRALVKRVISTRLAAEKGHLEPLEQVLREGMRENVFHRGSVQVVVQRVGQIEKSWQLSLAIVRTQAVKKLGCDDALWPLVERCCPCADSTAACRPWLRRVFSKSNLHVVSRSKSG